MCLTEHHLKYLRQLEKFHVENYNLGAHYCRQQCEKGGVAIFVHNSLRFTNINIAQHSKDQDIEICALKLSFATQNICILTFYTAPSGKFSTFFTPARHSSTTPIYTLATLHYLWGHKH